MIRFLTAALIWLLANCLAHAAITLDGSAVTGTIHGTGTITASASITTSSANDIIVVFALVQCDNSAGGAPSVTSVSDGNSLTWTKHKTFTFHTGSSPYIDVDIWWALASAAQSGNSITASYTTGGTCNANAVIIAQGFNGANTTTPFDTNVSIPTTGGSTSSAPSLSSVSTANASDMLLFLAAGADPGGSLAAQTSITFGGTSGTVLSDVNCTVGGSDFCHGSVGYLSVSSAQSSIAYTFGTSWTTWAAIATALQAGGAAPSCDHTLPLMGVGC